MQNKIALLGVIAVALLMSATTVFADSMTVVSDTTTQWSSNGTTWDSAVATWVHPSWPTSISGATWIWRTAETDAPWEYANVPDGGWYFQTTFTVPECADMDTIQGTLYVDADNSESSSINGVPLGQDGSLNRDGPDAHEWSTVESYSISTNLVKGENTLLFRAMNYFNYGPYNTNPAGLIFKADITYSLEDLDGDGYACGTDCNDNNAAINPEATEVCDGVDNDCDKTIDEGFNVGQSCTVGIGECASSGQMVCNAGGSGTECNAVAGTPAPEVCDEKDNDCDGEVDEGSICEFHCFSPETDTQYQTLGLGTNRWIWDGSDWITTLPKGKGPTFKPSLTDTHNCGCEQILTWLHENLPEQYGEMNGHWKYGCSISAIQDFMRLADEGIGTIAFAATESSYYNGPTNSSQLYANGSIGFTWSPITGHVTGGYYTEQAPPDTGTIYYNLVTGGTVVGDAVHLTFGRTDPNIYSFTADLTLSGNTVTGTVDGPYYFTATGTITP